MHVVVREYLILFFLPQHQLHREILDSTLMSWTSSNQTRINSSILLPLAETSGELKKHHALNCQRSTVTGCLSFRWSTQRSRYAPSFNVWRGTHLMTLKAIGLPSPKLPVAGAAGVLKNGIDRIIPLPISIPLSVSTCVPSFCPVTPQTRASASFDFGGASNDDLVARPWQVHICGGWFLFSEESKVFVNEH